MYGSIHLKREEERGDIDSWPPAALLPHSSCCPCAHRRHSSVGSFSSLSMQPTTHPHVWVTSCALCPDPQQPPPTPPPALLSHSHTQRHTMTGLLTTREPLKYGSARYVQTNTSCHSPSNSFLIRNSLTECSICHLICFT